MTFRFRRRSHRPKTPPPPLVEPQARVLQYVAHPPPSPVRPTPLPEPNFPKLPSSDLEKFDDLCQAYAKSPKDNSEALTYMLQLVEMHGPVQVLPLLLVFERNGLRLLLEVGKSLPDGKYGDVLVKRESKNSIYVGGWKMSNDTNQEIWVPNGRGAREEAGQIHLGNFKDKQLHGLGRRINTETGVKFYGTFSAEDSYFDGCIYDPRGDILECVILERLPKTLGTMIYHYKSGESIIGRPEYKSSGYILDQDAGLRSYEKYTAIEDRFYAFQRGGDLNGLYQWRHENEQAFQLIGDGPPELTSLMNWKPNFVHIAMIADLLTHSAFAKAPKSPSNQDFLQTVYHLLGPAYEYRAAFFQGLDFAIVPWGNDHDQLSFVARSMPLIDRDKRPVLEFGFYGAEDNLIFLFHQEKYDAPREMFKGAIQQFLDGMSIAYRADKRASAENLQNSNQVLQELLAYGPCADGRSRALVETLTKLNLLTEPVPEPINIERDGYIKASERFLEQFRQRALAAYISEYGGTLADSATIEEEPEFLTNFFSVDLFMQELSRLPEFSEAPRHELDAIRDHQQKNIGVLG